MRRPSLAADVLTQALARDWIDHPAPARRAHLEADSHVAPVWSSLETTRLGSNQQASPHGARQEPGPGDTRPVEQPEHEQRVWWQLTEIQQRTTEQRTAERTVDRDKPGLER